MAELLDHDLVPVNGAAWESAAAAALRTIFVNCSSSYGVSADRSGQSERRRRSRKPHALA
jgi:hypothetical protein